VINPCNFLKIKDKIIEIFPKKSKNKKLFLLKIKNLTEM